MNTLNLFNSIKNTVLKIEKELKQTNNTGIYFAPELYITFCIGKDIKQNQQSVFNTTNVEWSREINLGNGGPTDLIFKIGSKYTVIELKIRDNIHSYKRDIEKLKRLNLNAEKFFCVLLDSFTPTNDGRLNELEKEYPNTILRVGHHPFQTLDDRYRKQIFCNLNLYLIT